MANRGRFRSYTLARGTLLELTFCLMQQNWREFGDYPLLGDAWGAEASVKTVIRAPFGLYQQPLADFEAMVAILEGRDGGLRARLGLNRGVWVTERGRPNLGEEVTMMHEEIDELGVFRRMTFRTPGGPTTYVQVCAFPVPWPGGTRRGSVTVMAASATTPSWASHTSRH